MKIIARDINPCEKRMRVLHFHDFAWDPGATQKIPCIIKLEKKQSDPACESDGLMPGKQISENRI